MAGAQFYLIAPSAQKWALGTPNKIQSAVKLIKQYKGECSDVGVYFLGNHETLRSFSINAAALFLTSSYKETMFLQEFIIFPMQTFMLNKTNTFSCLRRFWSQQRASPKSCYSQSSPFTFPHTIHDPSGYGYCPMEVHKKHIRKSRLNVQMSIQDYFNLWK